MAQTYGNLYIINDRGATKRGSIRNDFCIAPCEGRGRYTMQDHQDIQKYHDYIMQLPGVDNPPVFGLHVSADMNYRNLETGWLITCVTNIQPKDTGGGGGDSPDQIVSAKCME